MEIAPSYTVVFDMRVHKLDFPRLSKNIRTAIIQSVEKKLTTHPDIFGKPLRGSLKNHWRLRVGDYRVVYRITGAMVHIFAIELRPTVYQTMKKRI